MGAGKGVDRELRERISKAGRAFYGLKSFWKREAISLKTKVWVYQATVMAVLLYGCPTWTLRQHQLQRLIQFQCRHLRRIFGIQREPGSLKLVSNNEVALRSGVTPVQQSLQKRRLKWFGHVCRMPEHRISRQLLFGRLTKARPFCGPELRWLDIVEHDFNALKLDWREAFTTTSTQWNTAISDAQQQTSTGLQQQSNVLPKCPHCQIEKHCKGIANHIKFCKFNPDRKADSRVIEQKRVKCANCERQLDPRRVKNHVKKCADLKLKQTHTRFSCHTLYGCAWYTIYFVFSFDMLWRE